MGLGPAPRPDVPQRHASAPHRCRYCRYPPIPGVAVKWITRARPKTDRIACPWLIRRFIDPEAEIIYVPAGDVLSTAEREGGHSFDAPDAEFTHRPAPGETGEWGNFETLFAVHHLTDPAP